MKLPESSKVEGLDSHGNFVRVGDVDTDGFLVGYIDDEGLSWESRQDRDAAVGGGTIHDSSQRDRTNLDAILDEAGVLPENRYAAVKEFVEGEAMNDIIRSLWLNGKFKELRGSDE
jgi:hypothetical protein